MNNNPSPLQVMEGLPSGTVIGTVTAKDPDEGENGTVYYSLSGESLVIFQPLVKMCLFSVTLSSQADIRICCIL